MVRVTQPASSSERPEAHSSRHKPPRKIARHSRRRADADREQLLRALLDEAHHRIRMLERTVEQLTAAL
jgi:hypothetical protein